MEKAKKTELIRTIKYVLIAASAGVIQLGTTTVLSLIWPVDKFANGPVLFYFIGLVLSVIWNLTINRKYTFKSADKMGRAVLLTIAFYLVFTPATMFLQGWLTNGVLVEGYEAWQLENHLGLHTIIGTVICMILNLALEYPYQRFVLFGKSIDTAPTKAKKAGKSEQTVEENIKNKETNKESVAVTKKQEKAPAKKAATKKPDLKEATRVYHVAKREDGKWAVKYAGGEKAIKLFATQKEAIEYTKAMAENQDGKMLVHNSKGQNKGRIKSK